MPSGIVQVRRPRAIVFDILGTASKSGFLERILFPFLKINLETYINTHWDKGDFIKLYKRIQEQSLEFNKQEPATPLVLDHEATQAKGSLLQFIGFVTDNGVNSPAVTQLRFKVWFEGYNQSRLRTPIYADVPASLKRWFAEGIKFYVFSNTWVEAQRALLRNTNHGDLTHLIAGHFDNDFGLLTEVDSWVRFCAQIQQSPNNVLFLTKSPAEGRAAQDAGISVVLVLTHRHNVKAVSHEDRQRFPYVRTLNDLQWTEGVMMPGGSEMPMQTTAGPMPTAISAANMPPASTVPVSSVPASSAHPSASQAPASSKPSSVSGSAKGGSSHAGGSHAGGSHAGGSHAGSSHPSSSHAASAHPHSSHK
uniref:Enolase-phosphatase E1 n=1 Tax=Aceria tosichella TaxID=561515 RepID=A0A6G1SK01_9ACAR